MEASAVFWMWAFIGFFGAVAASTSETPIKRQSVDCNDLAGVLDGSCWATLGLSDYLTQWNQSIPVCQGSERGSDGSACCISGEAWSTCFLRLGHGYSGADCSEINAQKCSYDATLSKTLDQSIQAQVHYVLATIYGTETPSQQLKHGRFHEVTC